MRPVLALDLDPDHRGPRFLAIAEALTRDILRGRLTAGQRLPGTRALAQALGVHRNTVDAAYQELVTQGWLQARPARGTFVAQDLPQGLLMAAKPAAPPDPAPPPAGLAFSDGAPDPKLMPKAALARAFRRALFAPAVQTAAEYGDARGTSALRQALAGYLATDRGVAAEAGQIIVTRGSQMALYLAARAVLQAGDVIAVEDPGYPQAWEAFRAAGAQVLGLPVDQGGLQIEALSQAIARIPRLRAVYVTPHHHYPTTVSMRAARRLQLLDLAQRQAITVIEDDYDHDYHFDGRPILPLAARAPEGLSLIYLGSLSKLLSTGIRLGYAWAPYPILQRMAALRVGLDRQGDVPLELALAEMIRNGDLGRHARKARRVYHARRDLLAGLLTDTLQGRAEFDLPTGGLALWLRCGEISAADWARRAGQAGLRLQPGHRFALGVAPQAFRLGYAALDDRQITRAVEILAQSLPDGD